VTVLSEVVDEGTEAGGAVKDGAPLLEGEVGGDDDGAHLVPSADDVEEQVVNAPPISVPDPRCQRPTSVPAPPPKPTKTQPPRTLGTLFLLFVNTSDEDFRLLKAWLVAAYRPGRSHSA
jgi:hypothetical protein